jgi:dCMP deaminase
MKRPSIERYAMDLAKVAATRSEDPFIQVGAVALTEDNRVIATAYNGLPKGFNAPKEFWKNRENRLKFMIHAEQNLCSLFKRGDARWIATTTMPCASCMTLLIAHGIYNILYLNEYRRDCSALEIAEKYNVNLFKL